MKYIVKHNIPNIPYKNVSEYDIKEEAMFTFDHIRIKCMGRGYSVKCFIRDDKNKPLRATLNVEVDNFTYYTELYVQ